MKLFCFNRGTGKGDGNRAGEVVEFCDLFQPLLDVFKNCTCRSCHSMWPILALIRNPHRNHNRTCDFGCTIPSYDMYPIYVIIFCCRFLIPLPYQAAIVAMYVSDDFAIFLVNSVYILLS